MSSSEQPAPIAGFELSMGGKHRPASHTPPPPHAPAFPSTGVSAIDTELSVPTSRLEQPTASTPQSAPFAPAAKAYVARGRSPTTGAFGASFLNATRALAPLGIPPLICGRTESHDAFEKTPT